MTHLTSVHWITRFLPVILFATLSVCEVASRPALPVDETRYLSVAWEMHVRTDYLVPHLNGATYAHKPPLLFWLINTVWAITGTEAWSARLVGPAISCLSVLMTGYLAKQLWPSRPLIAEAASLIHCSILLWLIFAPLTMFDALLTLFAQIAWLGLLRLQAGRTAAGIMLVGIGIGFGILSKGPMVLLHVLPVALSGPWWLNPSSLHARRWYLCVTAGLLSGAAIAFGWAIPAATSGGDAYANELLWGQTAGRMVKSFSHEQPFWFYLPFLPAILLPWSIFGGLWRAIDLRAPWDKSTRFCMAGFLGSFSCLSLVSGKQPYYLLPLMPMMAFLIAKWVTSNEKPITRYHRSFIAIGTILTALSPLGFNYVSQFKDIGLAEVCPSWLCIPLGVCGVALLVPGNLTVIAALRLIATTATLFMVTVVVGLSGSFWSGFDLRPLAESVGNEFDENIPVAWFGSYHGQLQFAGKLKGYLSHVDAATLPAWLQTNPDGRVVVMLAKDSGERSFSTPLRAEEVASVERDIEVFNQSLTGYQIDQVQYATTLRRGLHTGVMAIVSFEATPAKSVQPVTTTARE